MREVIPLKERRVDVLLLIFFSFNLIFITYLFDIEQIIVPAHFGQEVVAYPPWPPALIVDLGHYWGNTFDPLVAVRPAWFRATIWLDALVFGPFYMAAIYAYSLGKDWIRIPSVIYATMLFTNVFIILFDEIQGIHPAINLPVVIAANASWFLVPVLIIARMWGTEHPFTREVQVAQDGPV